MSYPPPPGAPPGAAPQYGQRRRGSPWPWILGGCAGCVVIVSVVLVMLGMSTANLIRSATGDIGPINKTTVQQQLGEVPLYPNGTLDETTTRGLISGFRVGEKIAGKQAGSIFRGLAVQQTQDRPEKVMEYYDQKLQAEGWKATPGQRASEGEARSYQKGNDVVMIQAQPKPGFTMVTIMRGGPGLTERARRRMNPGQE